MEEPLPPGLPDVDALLPGLPSIGRSHQRSAFRAPLDVEQLRGRVLDASTRALTAMPRGMSSLRRSMWKMTA
jgi:hypothetical protein